MDHLYKYPKTPHVPWSVGTSDDKTLADDSQFIGKEVVVTLKMDGENTSIYRGYMHARSLYPPNHPSQSWVKQLAGQIGWLLEGDERVCGENLYAKHTVEYNELPTYFMVFSIWKGDLCYDWKHTLLLCYELDRLNTVPVIYEGVYDKSKIIEAYQPYAAINEGYVIRSTSSFSYEDFDKNVAKFVNPEFRQALKESTVHWASAKVIPNKLKENVRTNKQLDETSDER